MHVSGLAPVSATEFPDTRESRTTDNAAAESFAGVLANALQPRPTAPAPQRPTQGTSELDRSPASAESKETEASASRKEDDEASTEKSSRKHAHRAHHTANADVVKSLDVLDPTLQDKLARVTARMQSETGLDVTVEETYRPQSRQDALYAQGRETSGPVVTWTHNSQHTVGRAVDVTLSGGAGPVGADAYTTLQRIANEEGLHTLGARDPGHLELPSTTASAKSPIDLKSLILSQPADASGSGAKDVPIAQVAQLAKVADVAVVAQPAQVARVASIGQAAVQGATTERSSESVGTPRPGAPTIANTTIAEVTSASTAGSAQQRSSRDGGQSGSSGGDARAYSAMAAAVALRNQTAGGGVNAFSLGSVAGTTGTSAAERVARVIEAIEDAPARPLSQITMNVDAGNGLSDRVQLSMRGSALNATIDAADARGAQALSGRADELARALTRDGIDLQSLHVRSAATAVAGALTTSSAQTSSDSSTKSQFDRGQPWQQQQDRQRSQQERRNSQRDQRGGQQQ